MIGFVHTFTSLFMTSFDSCYVILLITVHKTITKHYSYLYMNSIYILTIYKKACVILTSLCSFLADSAISVLTDIPLYNDVMLPSSSVLLPLSPLSPPCSSLNDDDASTALLQPDNFRFPQSSASDSSRSQVESPFYSTSHTFHTFSTLFIYKNVY